MRHAPGGWAIFAAALLLAAPAANARGCCKPELLAAQDVTAQVTGTRLAVTGNLNITITAPLNFTFSPAAPSLVCTAPAGTLVTTMTPTGGDGNPITYTMTGDTADFAVSGNTVVVGPNGIAPSMCPAPPALSKTVTQTVTGTQQ